MNNNELRPNDSIEEAKPKYEIIVRWSNGLCLNYIVTRYKEDKSFLHFKEYGEPILTVINLKSIDYLNIVEL